MGTKNTQKSSSNTTQQTDPASWAKPGLTDLASRITAGIPAAQQPNYTGDFVAQPGAFDANVAQGYAGAGAAARGMIPGLTQAMGTLQQGGPQFTGPGLSEGTQSFGSYDPSGVDSVVQAAIQPYIRQLTEQVLPSLQSAGIESGAYGGTRSQQTLPGMAIRDTGRMASEVAAGIGFEDFQQQQARMQNAYQMDTQRGLGTSQDQIQRMGMIPGMTDQIMRMEGGAAEYDAQAAAYDRMLRQSTIDNNMQQHQYQVTRPFQGLDIAAGLLGPLAAPYASHTGTSDTTQTQKQSGLGPILQGAMGLGAMAFGMPGGAGGLTSSLFGKPVPVPSPITVNSDMLNRGAAGAFSDRRLKQAIKKIGELADGIGLYSFKYLWSPEERFGVMADEVAEKQPWALGEPIMGFATVNYAALEV